MEARATIAAIASAPGGGARAVIRLSGPDAARITRRACTRDGAELVLAERGGVHARLDDGAGDMPVLVLWMPAPRSLTGEDVVEWHVPGAEPLARAALGRALALGASPARPGEFLRRAFEHGRIDLTRAEGVLALVRAGNEAERRAASALLAGGLSRRVERLRDRLVEARALCEASLDFDEADTGVVPREELAALAREVVAALEEARDWEVAREAPSALPRVVLVGRPNAGKSSLFNRLSGAAALVSDLAGTTRDALESRWRPAGLEVLLWDAAGVDDRPETPETRPSPPSPLGPAARGGSPGSVTPGNAAAPSLPELPHADPRPDLEARERARHLRASADLWLWVVDASREDCVTPPALAGEWRALGVGENPPPAILVLHKADLLPPDRRDALAAGAGDWTRAIVGGGAEGTVDRIAEPVVFGNPGPTIGDRPRVVVLASARTGLGVADLERAVASLLRAEPAPGEARGIAARHRAALEAALAWARESFDWLASGAGLDLAAHAARRATDELDQIQGRTTPEDLLDRIFERFCIGK